MDVIYHRNCLDGVFSAHLFYLMSKVIEKQSIELFLDSLKKKITLKEALKLNYSPEQYEKITDLTVEVLETQNTIQKQRNQPKIHIINEQFFHQPNKGVSYSAYSIFAGEFIPLKFPTNNKILFILDTNLVSYQNLIKIGQKYEYVVLIDHHTSFQPIKKQILLQNKKMDKLFYVFSEDFCATELCYFFLQKYFQIDSYFQQSHIKDLQKMISFVSKHILLISGANDRKHLQTKQSKSFVLGFYYFGIELSHMNPLLNKRLGMINLNYLMGKGQNLYKIHIQQISQEISKAVICTLEISGKLKGARFYITKPSNASKISDIGIVLSYLSKMHGMQNLAILYMQKSDQIRISTRSHRSLQNPLALQVAEKFQGGGHVCAAGFKISNNKFKSLFTRTACSKHKLMTSFEQVQKILLNQSIQK